MRIAYLYILSLFFLTPELSAQYRFDNYKHLTHADGLPSNYAYEFAEDKYGFIWIATPGGLARYDGSKLSKFTTLESDSIHLPTTHIISLLMRGDSLWIGTNKGLSILNIESGQLSNHAFEIDHLTLKDTDTRRNRIEDVYEDQAGNVWMAPSYGGFLKWDKKTESFSKYLLYPDKSLPKAYRFKDQTSINVIIQDVKQDSILWGASASGLVKLNTNTGRLKRILYTEGDEKDQFDVNRKTSIFQDSTGIIYTGSWQSGLSIFNPATNEYYLPSLRFPENYSKSLSGRHLFNIIDGEPGYLYLTYVDGLYRYNKSDYSFELIKKNQTKDLQVEFGIEFIDSENRTWFGSPVGVVVTDPIVQQYKWHSLSELNVTDYKVLPREITEDFYPGYISLVGQYTDGIYHINPSTGHKFKQVAEEHMKNDSYFHGWGITQIDKDNLLVLEDFSLFSFNKKENKLKPYSKQFPNQLSHYYYSLKDKFGEIWIGSKNDGLLSIDSKSNQLKSYKDEIPKPFVLPWLEDDKGNIWMIIERGHAVFERATGLFHVFEHSKDATKTYRAARSFCKCPNGEVWFAGGDKSLGKMDPNRPGFGIIEKIELKTNEGQLPVIRNVACNSQNELWARSNSGILKVKRKNWTVKRFRNDYGLKGITGIFQFLKNDELIISSRDGFYTINPDELKINKKLPKPYVTSIISNKGVKGKLEDHLKGIPIKLKPDENVITIEFSSINQTLSSRTKYQYILEGVDEEWKDPGNKRSFTYSYLPGGEYTFKVKACNNEGVWNDEDYELPIHVGTPWYKTSWFLLSLFFIALALAYLYYRNRIRRIEKESQLKTGFEKKVADLEMSALRAQMNPHFIFNCLNSIESYIIKNDTKKASQYLNDFSRLVRLILQNSRNSYVNLEDELESLKLYLQLEQMRFKENFTYEIILKENLNAEAYEIPPMLIQPYVENAIWHGLNQQEEGGKVIIEVQKVDDTLICIVEDNGIGRKAAAEIRASKKIKRKSMGMSITNERIEIINKIYNTNNKVEIEDLYDEDQNAQGTRVTLNIPL